MVVTRGEMGEKLVSEHIVTLVAKVILVYGSEPDTIKDACICMCECLCVETNK